MISVDPLILNKSVELKLAINLAVKGKEYLASLKQESFKIESSIGRDIKLKGDRLLNDYLVHELKTNSPHPVIAEESINDESDLQKEWVWIVDPIDGSFNFVRGLPVSCLCIALLNYGKPYLGVILDLNREELFYAVKDLGAYLNDKRIFVSNTAEKAQAVIATGFPSYSNFGDEAILEFVKEVQSYKKIRLIGSAALSLAYIACGRMDLYQETGIKLWDIASGIILVEEAGGKINSTNLQKNYSYKLTASNGKI